MIDSNELLRSIMNKYKYFLCAIYSGHRAPSVSASHRVQHLPMRHGVVPEPSERPLPVSRLLKGKYNDYVFKSHIKPRM